MSLQVWLPLTKNLTQQGLSNVSATNNGATYQSTGGKLGGVYSFGTGASSLSLPTSTFTSLSGDFSVACWIKILSWNSSYATFWGATSTSASWANVIAALCRNGSSSKLIFCLGNDSQSITSSCSTVDDIQLNTWYHFTCVYTAGKAHLYQNGTLIRTVNVSFTPKTTAVKVVNIGKSRESTYQSNCLMNDFRIYNHALSPMEVKELSKGLMLHYPLSRNGWGQENLFLNSSLTDLTPENLSTKIKYGNPYIPVITDDGIKFTWSGSGAREVDLYLGSGLELDTYYTLSFIYRSNMNISSSSYLRSDNTLVGYWSQKTIPYSENWSRYIYTFKPASYQDRDVTTGNSLTLFYSGYTENKWIELKSNSIKLEKGTTTTPWCPNDSDDLVTATGLSSTIEYDCSGFGNNGTKNNITYVSDTPKYSVSSVFNGTNSYVKVNDNTWMIKGMPAMTVNLWAKATTWAANGGRLLSCTETGGFNLEAGNSGYWRFPVYVYTNEAQTSSAYKYDSKEIKISDLTPNDWNMITLVYETTGTKTYLNGQLHHTYTNTSYGINFNTNARLFLGCEATGVNPYTPYFNGMESDFRIYATALSADDIKSLYENKGYVDNKGNIYGTLYEVE